MSEVEQFTQDGIKMFRYEGEEYLFNPLEQESATTKSEAQEKSGTELSETEEQEEKEKKQAGLDAIAGSEEESDESLGESEENTQTTDESLNENTNSEDDDNLIYDGSKH